MKILVLSDTHGLHRKVKIPKEHIDLVIHSGDAAHSYDVNQNKEELEDFLFWFSSLPIKHKIFVPGNHDLSLERGKVNPSNWEKINFLIDEMIEIEDQVAPHLWDNVKIYGSPWTPPFSQKQWAYTTKRTKIGNYWQDIPECDILITHGPPYGILDICERNGKSIEVVGDKSLLKKVKEINPKLHIFGHIHDQSNGVKNFGVRKVDGINFINASIKKDFGDFHNNPILLNTNNGNTTIQT